MTFRYIGSKTRLIDQITAHMGQPKQGAFFVDAFCGTGVVAEAAAGLGWNVRINDSLHSAVISAGARLISHEQATFKKLGGYAKAITKLNAAKPKHGFMWREYSPASVDTCGIERRYFTEENAARIDAMRALIADWSEAGTIDDVEERLLVADLFGALNRVFDNLERKASGGSVYHCRKEGADALLACFFLLSRGDIAPSWSPLNSCQT